MSIPLIQKPEKDDINTSIIAIKRNIERINMLLGLVDNDSPDLSGFATKQELQDAVTELQPVDEVTVGNMQSVSSNAVSKALSYSTEEHFTGKYYYDGKPIYEKVYLLQHAVGAVADDRFTISNDLDYVLNVDFVTSNIINGSTKLQFFHQGAWGTGFDWMITYYRENNQLVIKYGTAYVNWNFVLQVSVEYTKY